MMGFRSPKKIKDPNYKKIIYNKKKVWNSVLCFCFLMDSHRKYNNKKNDTTKQTSLDKLFEYIQAVNKIIKKKGTKRKKNVNECTKFAYLR